MVMVLTKIMNLIQWCYYNKMINEYQVKVVSEFKLLGVIIDDKLNFNAYASKIRKAINIRYRLMGMSFGFQAQTQTNFKSMTRYSQDCTVKLKKFPST